MGNESPAGAVDELLVLIASDIDVLTARTQGRAMAATLGFSNSDKTLIATAISEVARNIVNYAKRGEIVLRVVRRGDRRGILVLARDQGPGIPDVARAMEDGYSTGGSLGLGLPGSKRLMDEFEVASEVGKGTTVTMTKWQR
jgi:serine/threonine-protein kinase RsbT